MEIINKNDSIVLGFSVGHDRGATLMINGKIIVGITEERLSRIKHDSEDSIPYKSIKYCMEYANLNFEDIDLYVYNITVDENKAPKQFEELTGLKAEEKLVFIPHHMAHAYSTFGASGFKEAAVIVADAMGSVWNDVTNIKDFYPNINKPEPPIGQQWAEGYTIFHFKDNSVNEVYKKWIQYPAAFNDTNVETSLGGIYGLGSLQLIYDPNSNTWPAGKLMGMASYADQDFVKSQNPWATKTENDLSITSAKLHSWVDYNSDFQSKANVAGIYQNEQEQASLHLAKMAKKLTNSSNICVAGGSFLNCNSNELIIKSELFENCYFIPPSDDSGIPLGCAYFGSMLLAKMENKQYEYSSKWMSPYHGKKYTDSEIENAINGVLNLVNFKRIENFDEVVDIASELLSENKVIGWFQDGSEMGPRALGNRSILANPGCKWITNYINSEIKMREWYRPFAPSVLHEYQSDIFDLDVYSPYMLVTTTVKSEWRDKLPAITHVDNTARYQSVTSDNNQKYHNLISAFYKKTGLPTVLNTSFNGPDEPIVETPHHAIRTFLKRNIHTLIINNYIITRK